MTTHKTLWTQALLAGVVLTGAASVLAAGSDAETVAVAARAPQQQRVATADLNLGSEAGLAALERRIGRAAEAVCGSRDVREVGLRQAVRNRECARETTSRAMADVAVRNALASSRR